MKLAKQEAQTDQNMKDIAATLDELNQAKKTLSTRILENRVQFENTSYKLTQLQEKEVVRVDDLEIAMKNVQEQLEIALKSASKAELISKQNQKEVQKFEQTKFSVTEQAVYADQMRQTIEHLTHKIDDVYNRSVSTDLYLEKYLPYNTFVQMSEVLHVALDAEHLKKIANYENAKLQNYLADILLDMGRHKDANNGATLDH